MKIIAKLLICLLTLPATTIGQDIQVGNHDVDIENNIKKVKDLKKNLKEQFKGKVFSFTGGISLNGIYTGGDNFSTNNQPFTYMASGNVRLSIYKKFSIGANFNYSNKKFSFNYNRPNPTFRFNRLSLRPKYKNWSGQIGDASVSFSPYTLSGVQFTGGAIQYSKKFTVQTLYGRFFKAVAEDTAGLVKPSYKRMGWGVKAGRQKNGKKLGVAVFHARDDVGSIPVPTLIKNKEIKPMEGTAIELEAALPFLKKKLTWEVTYALSILTPDLSYIYKEGTSKKTLLHQLVHTANPSTNTYHALKTGLNYSLGSTGVGIAYEHVDPEYRTLGAYYFTNDFRNITVNLNQSLFKQKVNLSFNTGIQEDDLKSEKERSMKRIVLSGNANVRASKKMNITASYSNLQSYTYINSLFNQVTQTSPYENLDTLDFTQLSQNASAAISYQLNQSKSQSQSISVSTNLMVAANERGGVSYKGDVTRFLNSNLSHTLQLTPYDLSIATAFMYSLNYAALQKSSTCGPSLNISKSFFKKLMRINLGGTYSVAMNVLTRMSILNIRAGAAVVIKKKHNINFTFLSQKRMAAENNQFFTGNIGYSFNF